MATARHTAEPEWTSADAHSFLEGLLPKMREHGFKDAIIVGSVREKGVSYKDLDILVLCDEQTEESADWDAFMEAMGFGWYTEGYYEFSEESNVVGSCWCMTAYIGQEKVRSVDFFFYDRDIYA
jgi:hypothetical protein